jgi:hypothetical protein
MVNIWNFFRIKNKKEKKRKEKEKYVDLESAYHKGITYA